MSKLTLNDITNLNNQQSAVDGINHNYDLVEAFAQDTLSRSGLSPNAMNSPLDMNSNQIFNLPEPGSENSPLRLQDLENVVALTGGSANLPVATQAQAEAGSSNLSVMTPLRTTELLNTRLPQYNTQSIVIPSLIVSTAATFPCRKDIYPVECPAPSFGRVSKLPNRLFHDLSESGQNAFIYVSNSGDDGNAGTRTSPYATLSQAIRVDTNSNVQVDPGSYDPFEFRTDTDPGSVALKRITNSQSGRGRPVVITVTTGPGLASQTFTKTSGKTNIYETTLTLSGLSVPHRVIFLDREDVWGFLDRPTQYSNTSDLDASSSISGWFFDSGTKKLYINFFGLNVDTFKAKFKAYYTDSNNNSRIFLFGGVSIIFDGLPGDFIFDGIEVLSLNNGSGGPTSAFVNVTSQYSPSNGFGASGGLMYNYNTRVHACASDCFNYNPSSGFTAPAMGIEYNCFNTMAGDKTSFPSIVENKNGSSAHGGGNLIRIGGFYADNLGPNIVDTTSPGYDSYTWNVGVVTQKSSALSNVGGIQNVFSDGGGTRTMWCDSCRTIDEQSSITSYAGVGSITYYTNCDLNVPPNVADGATLATYQRNTP